VKGSTPLGDTIKTLFMKEDLAFLISLSLLSIFLMIFLFMINIYLFLLYIVIGIYYTYKYIKDNDLKLNSLYDIVCATLFIINWLIIKMLTDL